MGEGGRYAMPGGKCAVKWSTGTTMKEGTVRDRSVEHLGGYGACGLPSVFHVHRTAGKPIDTDNERSIAD